jgi:type IV secretory pathway VirJ component
MGLYRHIRLAAAILLALCGPVASALRPALPPSVPVRESRYRLAPFGTVTVYDPTRAPRGVALFLSGDGGWDETASNIARAIAGQGLLVAGISTPTLMKALNQPGTRCINPNYPLVDLARDVQHRMAVPSYEEPIVIGYSSGATVAYAGLAQWPNGGYRGVISMGFSADMPGRKPWCTAPGFAARWIVRPVRGWLFAHSRKIKIPWVVLQGQQDSVVDPVEARRFAARVPGTKLIELPLVGHGFADQSAWLPQMRGVLDQMLPAPVSSAAISDMPLTVVPATGRIASDSMAIIYSGDGGWVGIDRDVAQHLAAAGIPVVGVDSLSYFWSARTPDGAAADLRRVIAAYSARWHRPHVLLIGYSFGADTLPSIVGRLDPAIRSRIASLSLLGLSPTADFQFHLGSWLDISSAQATSTIPAVAALKGLTIRCIRGVLEKDSACPAIPVGISQNYSVPGGHHFDRNAALLAQIIQGRRPAGTVLL